MSISLKFKLVIRLTLLISLLFSLNSHAATTLPHIFVIQDDGTLVRSGYVESDIGLIDTDGEVDKEKTIKKFFQDHPDAMNIYDFIILATTFKPGDNLGQFTSLKNEIKGTGDFREDINLVSTRMNTGLSGEEKFQGYAFVMNLDNIGNDLYLLLHELSHRWLFRLGDYDSCGKGFGCTRETGFKISSDGTHFNSKINTLTKEGDKTYKDPNGGGSMVLAPTSGYCLDFGGGGDGYRFTDVSLYLMGLISSDQIVPLKWYTTTGSWSEKGIPCIEKTFGVQDIISLVGSRDPAFPNTQRDFSVAYVLLTKQGQTPTDVQISKMNFIAENFPKKWTEATRYKSTINGVQVSQITPSVPPASPQAIVPKPISPSKPQPAPVITLTPLLTPKSKSIPQTQDLKPGQTKPEEVGHVEIESEKISEDLIKKGVVDTVKAVERVEQKGEVPQVVYRISGHKKVKLFFIIPVIISTDVDVSAGTGRVMKINKPWWSFLTR